MSIWLHINLSILKRISRANKGRKTIFTGHISDSVHPRRQSDFADHCLTVSCNKSYDHLLRCICKDGSPQLLFKKLNTLVPSQWDLMARQQQEAMQYDD